MMYTRLGDKWKTWLKIHENDSRPFSCQPFFFSGIRTEVSILLQDFEEMLT